MCNWNIEYEKNTQENWKTDNIKRVMRKMHVKILQLCEIRLVGAGKLNSDYYNIICSGGNQYGTVVGIILERVKHVAFVATITSIVVLRCGHVKSTAFLSNTDLHRYWAPIAHALRTWRKNKPSLSNYIVVWRNFADQGQLHNSSTLG